MRPGAVSDERNHPLHSWERFVALLGAAIALALNVAAAIQLFAPQTTLGYRLIYTRGFEVAAVDPETPAARAGIAAGNYLDFTKSQLHDRIVGLLYQPATPGESVRVSVSAAPRAQMSATARGVTLHAEQVGGPATLHAISSPIAPFIRLAGFAYIAIALIILLRRPNRMTFGLFFYLIAATDVSLYRFPDSLFPLAQFGSDLLDIAGPIGLVVFAARFPDNNATGWRRSLDRLAIPVGALLAIPNLAWDVRSIYAGAAPAAWMVYGSVFGALALIAVASATLFAAYFAAPPAQRQRFQWALGGVLLTLLSYISAWARYLAETYPLTSSDALVWIAAVLYACAPFAIAYAVVRQRVFDISFVVSRGLVFTIVSAFVFGILALIEWFVGRVLEQNGVALALVALTAIGVAFSLDALYRRAEDFVERTLFRRRRQAEQRIARIAAGLPYAESGRTVEAALVAEPIQAFALDSATLFKRETSGNFFSNGTMLDRQVLLQVQGRHGSLRLHEGSSALAVPIFVRARLEAVVLYGAHANGEDIDPDEKSSLEAMGVAAGIAYDHLETARVERDAGRWRKVAERQARELAALRERVARFRER
ncbi:MAG TPA: hypothetical protein VHT92_07725 [Candidatus Cybelea sp.]|jgi:hypothetical protein|nr:hypothetical protein [Candidatus Cybelea sp.]